MKKNTSYSIVLGLFAAFPLITFAAGKTLRDIVLIVISYLSLAIYLIIGLAVVTFVWNVYRYFFTEKEKKEAGMYVLWSTIGFFVILSFWGLVNIFTNSLKLDSNQPNLPFSNNAGGSIFNPPGTTNSTPNNLPGTTNPTPNNLPGTTNR